MKTLKPHVTIFPVVQFTLTKDWILGKKTPGTPAHPSPLPSLDPCPNRNPNLTLILTLYEGFFPEVFFPDTKRLTLLNIINVIDTSILEKNDSEATKVLRYG